MPVEDKRVFQYGLLAPTPETADRVGEVLRSSRRFYNACIDVHRRRKLAIWELDSPLLKKNRASLGELYVELSSVRSRINKLRCSKPEGSEARAGHQGEVDSLKAEGQAYRDQIKILKDTVQKLSAAQWKKPEHKAKAKEVGEPFQDEFKVLYKDSGLEFGIYNAILRSAEQASQKTKGLPRFQSFTGEGVLTVQLQGGAGKGVRYQSPEGIFTKEPPLPRGSGSNPYLQIDPVDPRAWDSSVPKGQRKRFSRTKLRLKIGSEGSRPFFAEFPMIMHRPLPEGALVVGASVSRVKHANRDRWTVHLTVKTSRPSAVQPLAVGKSIAIDLGWRSEDGGLRVGYWANSEGGHGVFSLPASVRERFGKARAIQGVRSQMVDELKARLFQDLKNRDSLPLELREEIAHIHNWKSARRFALLWRRHRDTLRPHLSDRGASEPFRVEPALKHLVGCADYFEAWFHRDRHLWQYEVGVRRKVVLHRNYLYAGWAAKMVAEYDYIIVEDLKVANLSKKPKPERKADLDDDFAAMKNAAGLQRTEAAVATLKGCLVNAARREGKLIVQVSARNTSKVCNGCGHKCKLTHEKLHTCEGCGILFDRDHNASLNILARGQVLLGNPEALAGANLVKKPRQSRFAKRHVKAERPLEAVS